MEFGHELEGELSAMFDRVLSAWAKHNVTGGALSLFGFFTPNYVLYRLLQILQKTEYMPCCSMIKSINKLQALDERWCIICTELNWEIFT